MSGCGRGSKPQYGRINASDLFVDDFDKLRTDYDTLQTLVDKYEKANTVLAEENLELLKMIREYQRRLNPDFYPEETKEEAEMLEDLSDDYPFTDAEIQERIDAENAEYVVEENPNK